MLTPKRTFGAVLLALSLAACDQSISQPDLQPEPELAVSGAPPDFHLTILHSNDGESELLPGDEYGGVARFARTVDDLRTDATDGCPVQCGVVLVSSGDNFLAGPEFSAALANGVPYFDALAQDLIGYDASAIGNHEFDFGPDVLARYIESFAINPTPFLSANLDVSGEPALAALEASGRIARGTVIEVPVQRELGPWGPGGRFGSTGAAPGRGPGKVKEGMVRVGIVGATTPRLASISSPRNVRVMEDVAAAINREVDRLTDLGVEVVVLISHLQSVDEDLALIPMLHGVDVAVAGGGDELLANPGDPLIPGDESEVSGAYPLVAMDATGKEVPVITTSGQYRYVGRLEVAFRGGDVTAYDGGPVRVEGAADPDVETRVEAPVAQAVATLQATVIGTSTVDLDGRRSQVRTVETNEGNLIADALLWQASALAGSFGVPTPDVGIQNGGGIRNDAIFAAGPITEFDTFDFVPFPNFVTIVPDVSRTQFKEILEHAVSNVEGVDGRFAQVAGVSFSWDPAGTAQVVDEDDGSVLTPGSRIVDVVLEGGEVLVAGGVVQPGADITVATIDFLARGGDDYPYRGAPFTTIGVTYQQALSNYIQDALGGTVTAVGYPLGGEGRIIRLP